MTDLEELITWWQHVLHTENVRGDPYYQTKIAKTIDFLKELKELKGE